VKRKEREGHLRRKYGITIGDYDAMLAAQRGGCAICGAPEPATGSLHVDHDHATGAVRGLLCVRCNNALGQFNESDALFQAAADYLDLHDRHRPALSELIRERAFALVGTGSLPPDA